MRYFIDIDDTICYTHGMDYSKAIPIPERIKTVNKLYDQGHEIVYWTARGTVTGKDWREVTERQFREWEVKYHELRFGKPAYDYFIDDKNINSEDFFYGD
jgi:dTDP-glucose 4,6-dehydratase